MTWPVPVWSTESISDNSDIYYYSYRAFCHVHIYAMGLAEIDFIRFNMISEVLETFRDSCTL